MALTGQDPEKDLREYEDVGGCRARALAQYPEPETPIDTTSSQVQLTTAQVRNLVQMDIFTTPEVRGLNQEWRTCMADHGVEMEKDLQTSPDPRSEGPWVAMGLAIATDAEGNAVPADYDGLTADLQSGRG